MPARVQVERHVVVYDANFRRREGERRFYGDGFRDGGVGRLAARGARLGLCHGFEAETVQPGAAI